MTAYVVSAANDTQPISSSFPNTTLEGGEIMSLIFRVTVLPERG